MVRAISLRMRILNYCLLLVFISGCSRTIDPNEAIARVNSTNMQRLANLYFTYQMKNGWMGPKDETEFKKFLRSYNPKKLTRIGIDPNAIDELFKNERDGEPFKIRYSVPGSAMGSSEPVIFESVGVDGKRMVGFLDMQQREVDQAEYADLWAGKASPQQSTNRGTWKN
jgi:hypothetical protein